MRASTSGRVAACTLRGAFTLPSFLRRQESTACRDSSTLPPMVGSAPAASADRRDVKARAEAEVAWIPACAGMAEGDAGVISEGCRNDGGDDRGIGGLLVVARGLSPPT